MINIDVLRFLAMPDGTRQRNARGVTKGDTGDIITPIDPTSGYGQWKHIKNARGWPWDLKLYNDQFVYDWITEGANGWSDDVAVGPKSFKKFIANHYDKKGHLNDGLPMFHRFVDTVSNISQLRFQSDKTMYAIFEGCVQVGQPLSLGEVVHTLVGPFTIDHGGDVGRRSTLIHQYYWIDIDKVTTAQIPTLEENYYALDRGWVAWKLHTLNRSTGFYELKNETVEVNVYPVTDVKIIFPCF